MIELVYTSASRGLPTDAELLALLRTARTENAERDITGLLAYSDGAFMQIIEGPEEAVDEIFDRIRQDTRHERVALLVRRPIEVRSFERWTMAFVPLGDVANATTAQGFDRFLLDSPMLTTQELTSQSRRLLLRFRELAA